MLASPDRLSENVLVHPVVIPELKLGNVEREILAADFVECADHAALNQRPETFDCLSMNRANNVLADRMVNARVWVITVKRIVASPLIGAKQTDFRGNALAHKFREGRGPHVVDDAGDHVALTAHGSCDDGLARTDSTGSTATTALVPMPVLGFAADESLVHLHDAHELAEGAILQTGADAVTHIPSGAVRAEAEHPVDLQGADAFLARQHQVHHPEPVAQRLVGVLEDRPRNMGETVSVRCAFLTLPMPLTGRQIIDGRIAATRATDTFGPAMRHKIGRASIFIRESLFPFGYCHLVNALFAVLQHLAFSRQYVERIPC